VADSTTTIETLKNQIAQFIAERNWQQFHSPKNLSMMIVSEATELMDLFLWCDIKESHEMLEKKREAAEDEIADVAFALLAFCSHYTIDLSSAIERKKAKDALKYPVEKCYGKAVKYTEL
jgi:dCTP diphosphatase